MPEQYDDNAEALDAWLADPDRTREAFHLRDVKNLPRIDAPSAFPEYVLLSALAGVLAVIVYFALKLLLRGGA